MENAIALSPEMFSPSCNSSIDEDRQKKNRDQWHKVLRTFDLIKDKTPVNNKINFRKRPSSHKKTNLSSNQRKTPSPKGNCTKIHPLVKLLKYSSRKE